MSVTIWIGGQPIGDTGSPRVIPSTLTLTADDAGGIVGPQQATFVLTWAPRDRAPAFDPFTPVQVEVDSIRVWSGYTWTTSRNGRQLSVTCEGTKNDLAGDLVSLSPLDVDMTGWQDLEPLLAAGGQSSAYPVPLFAGQSQVSNSQNGLVLTYPTTPSGWTNSSSYAVTAIREAPGVPIGVLFVVAFSGSMGGRFRVWGDSQVPTPSGVTFAVDIPDSTAQQVVVAAIPAPPRYLKCGYGWSPSSSIPTDLTATVLAAWIYDGASYLVHGSDVAQRVAALCPKLSADLSQIVPTPAFLGHAAWPDPGAAPATVLSNVAEYDDPLVGVDAFDRLVFQPRASVPTFEMGSQCPPSSETPSDPSTLVTDVIVSGPNSSGAQVSRRFTALDLPEEPRIPAVGASISNGFFSVNVAGWTPSPGTQLVRSGSGGPAVSGGICAVWASTTSGQTVPPGSFLQAQLTGTFIAGRAYQIEFWAEDTLPLNSAKTPTAAATVTAYVYDAQDYGGQTFQTFRLSYGTGWSRYTLTWRPRKTAVGTAWLMFDTMPVALSVYSDGKTAYAAQQPGLAAISIYQLAQPGPLDANLVVRTAQQAVPLLPNDDVALLLGQTYLRGALRQALTAVRACADGAAKDPGNGAPLPAATLLGRVGTLARCADREDPVTGQIGALQYVSAVSYDHASRAATVTTGVEYGAFTKLLAALGGA